MDNLSTYSEKLLIELCNASSVGNIIQQKYKDHPKELLKRLDELEEYGFISQIICESGPPNIALTLKGKEYVNATTKKNKKKIFKIIGATIATVGVLFGIIPNITGLVDWLGNQSTEANMNTSEEDSSVWVGVDHILSESTSVSSANSEKYEEDPDAVESEGPTRPMPHPDITVSTVNMISFENSANDYIISDASNFNQGVYDLAMNSQVYIRNHSEQGAWITGGSVKIHSIDLYETVDIEYDIILIDQTLVIYAINNGWGDSGPIRYSITTDSDEGGFEPVNIVEDFTNGFEKPTIKGASIEEIISGTIDMDEYKRSAISYNYSDGYEYWYMNLYLSMEYEDGTSLDYFLIQLEYIDGRFQLEDPRGGGYPVITQYIKIGPDMEADEIPLFMDGNTVYINRNDSERLDIVTIAEKSCQLTYSIYLEIDGDDHYIQSNELMAIIEVPIYSVYGESLQKIYERGIKQYTYGLDPDIQTIIEYDPLVIL